MAMNEQFSNGNQADDPMDARLAGLYRETAREEPPAHLDAAILAAARREAGARPRRAGAPFLRSWHLPASIAAVMVLTVSVVTLMVEEGGEQLVEPPRSVPQAAREEPAVLADQASKQASPLAKPSEPAPRPSASTDGRETKAETRMAEKNVPVEVGQRPASAIPPAAIPQPFPADPPSTVPSEQRAAEPKSAPEPDRTAPPLAARRTPQMSSDAAPTRNDTAAGVGAVSRAAPSGTLAESTSRDDAKDKMEDAPRSARLRGPHSESARESSSSSTGIRGFGDEAPPAPSGRGVPEDAAPAPAAKPAPSALQKSALVRQYELQPPEKWIEKIIELRRDRKTVEADEMLVEFKKRFPEHPLPAALR